MRIHNDHKVNADRDPDLRLHGLFVQLEERLYAKVLLDPFEEEFDLSASLGDLRDDQRVDLEVVGCKDRKLSGFPVAKSNPPQVVIEERLGLRPLRRTAWSDLSPTALSAGRDSWT